MRNPDPLPRPAYEPQDAEPRVIAATAASLAAVVGICIVVAAVIHSGEAGGRGSGPPAGPDSFFQHGPQAGTAVDHSWAEIDLAVHAHLGGYAWVDRRAGIVRVPIDRAIDLVCAEQKQPPPPAPAVKANTP
jgi:hypothetical protein